MKSLILLTFAALACTFSAYSFSANAGNDPAKELIVAFEKLSSKQYDELESAFKSIEGLKHVGQCENMQVYYFNYDTNVFRNAEEAFDALTIKTKNFLPLMKVGSSIQQVNNACNQ